jgi:hypothetical protein
MFECKRQRAALRTLAAEATYAAAAAEQRGLRADETKPEWAVCQVLDPSSHCAQQTPQQLDV